MRTKTKPKKKKSPVKPKPGYQTTEFWITVAADTLAIVATIKHKSTGTDVTPIIDAGTLLCNAVYGFSRSKHKSDYLRTLIMVLGPTVKQLLQEEEK